MREASDFFFVGNHTILKTTNDFAGEEKLDKVLLVS